MADLRDRASDMRGEDMLRVSGEAFDVWARGAARKAHSELALAELDAVDQEWGRAFRTATRALRLYRADPASQRAAWERARAALLALLWRLGALP